MMFESQDISKAIIVIHRRDRATIPRLTEIKAGTMLASTPAVARVTCGASQPVSICENVEPGGYADALAEVGSPAVPDALRTHEPREINGPSLIE